MNDSVRYPAGDWDAGAFFATLVKRNRLAKEHDFRYAAVSGLQGFADALTDMHGGRSFVCVSDVSDGFTDLNNPSSRRIKTVFLAMRHTADNHRMAEARKQCMIIMRELFRQFMSALNQEKSRIDCGLIGIDSRVSFNEMERYFFSGCACAYFQIAVDLRESLCYNPEEWEDE